MKRMTEEEKEAVRRDREIHGMTLYQLVEKHGRSKSTIYEIIKNCDDSNVVSASPSRKARVEEVNPKPRPDLSKSDIGEAARQIICGRLMWNEVDVYRPLSEDTPVDLMVMKKDGSVCKVQCKYIYPSSRGCHEMSLKSVRPSKSGKVAKAHRYQAEEVDVFIGYCNENDSVYVIPYEEMKGRNAATFWILRSPQHTGQKRRDWEPYRENYDLLK